MGGGGPHAAYLACRDEFKRSHARAGWWASASTRTATRPTAWRCRRASSTSAARRPPRNICTAQVLLAVMASMYAVYHGPAGLKRIAQRVASYTAILAAGPARAGRQACAATAPSTRCALDTGAATADIAARAVAAGMNLRRFAEWGDTMLGIALDETTTRDDIARAVAAVRPAGPGAARHRRVRQGHRADDPARRCAAAAPS